MRAPGVAVLVLALALVAPGVAVGKRKPPQPPPPPPDSAADCTFVVQPSIDDYLVLATLLVGVRCDTTKQRIDVTLTEFTRDGASVPILPTNVRSCTGVSECFAGSTSSRTTTIRSRFPVTSSTARLASGSSVEWFSDRARGASSTRGSSGA